MSYYELSKNHTITFKWVRGHADNANNNRCDELATDAADGGDLLVDEGYEVMICIPLTLQFVIYSAFHWSPARYKGHKNLSVLL